MTRESCRDVRAVVFALVAFAAGLVFGWVYTVERYDWQAAYAAYQQCLEREASR